MLEMYRLRESEQNLRQQLSHVLYQNDAACRVIARLKKERDEARAALAESHQRPQQALSQNGDAAVYGVAGSKRAAPDAIQANDVATETATGADEQPQQKKQRGALPDALRKSIDDTLHQLTTSRKNRKISETLLTYEEASKLSLTNTFPVHKANCGGTLGLHTCPYKDSILLSCGGDGHVIIFDANNGEISASAHAHSKKATCVRFADSVGNCALSGGADRVVRMWGHSEDDASTLEKKLEFSEHSGQISSVLVHPNETIAASAGTDGMLALYDIKSGSCLNTATSQLRQNEHSSGERPGYLSAALHVDGALIGAGNDVGDLELWDVRTMECVTRLPGHGSSGVRAVSFSENATTASACGESGILVWDLRKCVGQGDNTDKQKYTLNLFQNKNGASQASALHFDHSGHYLAAGGLHASVLMAKQGYASAIDFQNLGQRKYVKSLAFGADAKRLFIGASDHKIREYAFAEQEE